jgi:hypothetical protein
MSPVALASWEVEQRGLLEPMNLRNIVNDPISNRKFLILVPISFLFSSLAHICKWYLHLLR